MIISMIHNESVDHIEASQCAITPDGFAFITEEGVTVVELTDVGWVYKDIIYDMVHIEL